MDDPIIHPSLLQLAVESARTNPSIFLVITQLGGHLGWLRGWSGKSWMTEVVMQFLECVLAGAGAGGRVGEGGGAGAGVDVGAEAEVVAGAVHVKSAKPAGAGAGKEVELVAEATGAAFGIGAGRVPQAGEVAVS